VAPTELQVKSLATTIGLAAPSAFSVICVGQ
jgi:hypothetical protein